MIPSLPVIPAEVSLVFCGGGLGFWVFGDAVRVRGLGSHLLVRSYPVGIHGTGIFTYMNG